MTTITPTEVGMCDQPISAIKVKDENIIDGIEFETAWESANDWKIANKLVNAQSRYV